MSNSLINAVVTYRWDLEHEVLGHDVLEYQVVKLSWIMIEWCLSVIDPILMIG